MVSKVMSNRSTHIRKARFHTMYAIVLRNGETVTPVWKEYYPGGRTYMRACEEVNTLCSAMSQYSVVVYAYAVMHARVVNQTKEK